MCPLVTGKGQWLCSRKMLDTLPPIQNTEYLLLLILLLLLLLLYLLLLFNSLFLIFAFLINVEIVVGCKI